MNFGNTKSAWSRQIHFAFLSTIAIAILSMLPASGMARNATLTDESRLDGTRVLEWFSHNFQPYNLRPSGLAIRAKCNFDEAQPNRIHLYFGLSEMPAFNEGENVLLKVGDEPVAQVSARTAENNRITNTQTIEVVRAQEIIPQLIGAEEIIVAIEDASRAIGVERRLTFSGSVSFLLEVFRARCLYPDRPSLSEGGSPLVITSQYIQTETASNGDLVLRLRPSVWNGSLAFRCLTDSLQTDGRHWPSGTIVIIANRYNPPQFDWEGPNIQVQFEEDDPYKITVAGVNSMALYDFENTGYVSIDDATMLLENAIVSEKIQLRATHPPRTPSDYYWAEFWMSSLERMHLEVFLDRARRQGCLNQDVDG